MRKKSTLHFFLHAAGISLLLMALLAGCQDESSPSSEKNITAFKIGNAAGAIYGEKAEIYIVLPQDAALTALTPEISLSSGASVSPKSGEPADFSFPLTFTVTAENGSVRQYVVKASRAAALEYLSVRQPPFKTVYTQGEALDLAGLIVDGYYSDGTRKTEAVAPADVSGYDPDKAGEQALTITAGGGTVQFTVTVGYASPLALEIGFPKAGGADLAVYGLPAGELTLSVREQNNLPKSIVISAGGKQSEVYSGIEWSVDGTVLTAAADNIITIKAADYAYTIPHTLTLVATKDGARYSRTVAFTVVR